MKNEMLLTSIEQVRALSHSTRQRILNLLSKDARTNQQLAVELGEPPARILFHVRELLNAGLVELVEERPKGGVIEKYYKAKARIFRYDFSVTTNFNDELNVMDSTINIVKEDYGKSVEFYNGIPPYTSISNKEAELSMKTLEEVKYHLECINQLLIDDSREEGIDDRERYVFSHFLFQLPSKKKSRDD